MNGRPDPDRHDPAADDDVWRDLVARLGGSAGERSELPAPNEPSAAERAAAAAGDADASAPAGFSQYDPLGLAAARGERDADAERPGAAGEGPGTLPGDFVPDEPDPVLVGADPVAVLAWCGALGGPVALLVCALVWRSVPGYAIVLLIAAFVGGVGTLIMRLPRSKDDDGDDGARI